MANKVFLRSAQQVAAFQQFKQLVYKYSKLEPLSADIQPFIPLLKNYLFTTEAARRVGVLIGLTGPETLLLVNLLVSKCSYRAVTGRANYWQGRSSNEDRVKNLERLGLITRKQTRSSGRLLGVEVTGTNLGWSAVGLFIDLFNDLEKRGNMFSRSVNNWPKIIAVKSPKRSKAVKQGE